MIVILLSNMGMKAVVPYVFNTGFYQYRDHYQCNRVEGGHVMERFGKNSLLETWRKEGFHI